MIIEAVVDPFESPMLSNVTLGQAIKFALSLTHSEPNGSESPLTVLADKVHEFIWQAVDKVRQVNPPCDEDSKVRTHEEDTDD